MLLYYVDASADREEFVLSAMRLYARTWKAAFEQTKHFRRTLRERYGLRIKKELHATELVRGKGDLGSRPVSKYQRSQIFRETLQFITTLPEVQILNVCVTVPHCPVDPYIRAFERLLNRVQKNLEAAADNGLMILDEGKEPLIRKVSRQMAVFNWIPSKYGGWENGNARKNIAVSRTIEDPIFRRSADCNFLQFADVIAFALLKQEVTPTPLVTKYAIHKMFPILEPVLCLKVSAGDKQGIERG